MNNEDLRDYYGLLKVSRNATVSEIHKAYWQQASSCHPDKGGSHELMVQLVEAWKILSDPEKRARYDQELKYRKEGWRSRRFNEDVQDARKRARGDAAGSWAEFEAIYQKAFYTFNQDFYGEDIDVKAAGPYSPLVGSTRSADTSESKPVRKTSNSALNIVNGAIFAYIVKTVIMFSAIVGALFVYRNYSGIGRYVPLWQPDVSYQMMLDTTNGAVYFVEKRDGSLSSTWKQSVSPFPRENMKSVK